MALPLETINDDRKLRKAIDLIKMHITEKESRQNIDLHRAIQLIVDVGRNHKLLDHAWSARLSAELLATAPMLYACDGCAADIERGGVSDDEGRLELNGRVGDFYALCSLCGGPATHEVAHKQVAA